MVVAKSWRSFGGPFSIGHRSAISADRLAGTFARDILDRLLIDLSRASSRLEGNTYSLLDTERLIRAGEVAVGKNAKETQMILNHQAAIELPVNSADEKGNIARYGLRPSEFRAWPMILVSGKVAKT
jgi:Fic family protein